MKIVMIVDFFRSKDADTLQNYPAVSLIQPITLGAANLEGNLRSRLSSEYPTVLQHLWVCDGQDKVSLGVCKKLKQQHTEHRIEIITTRKPGTADKVHKMNLGLQYATGEVYAFIDDDIEVGRDTIRRAVKYLERDRNVGAVFGLPRAVMAGSLWTKLNSLFVNTQALFFYVPQTYFFSPNSIIGHLFFINKKTFDQIGGLPKQPDRFDDDNYLAVKLRAQGRVCVQTPLMYSVHNHFQSGREFLRQMKRWFVFPKNSIIPHATLYEKVVSSVLCVDVMLPSLSVVLFVLSLSTATFFSLIIITLISWSTYYLVAQKYLGLDVELIEVFLLPIVVFVLPFYIFYVLSFANNNIYWRGRHLHIKEDGYYDLIS
jgi:cellulose synthase/poly-beta-1,6-N-acetylglucosamine synthase-like glycosyltransferase